MSIDPTNGATTVIGKIVDDAIVGDLGWNEADGQLVGTLTTTRFPNPNPADTSIISISKSDGTMTALFDTPYSQIFGLATDPDQPGRFVAYVNDDTGSFYTEIDAVAKTHTQLGSASGVFVGHMVFLTFDASSETTPEPDSLWMACWAIGFCAVIRRRKSRRQ